MTYRWNEKMTLTNRQPSLTVTVNLPMKLQTERTQLTCASNKKLWQIWLEFDNTKQKKEKDETINRHKHNIINFLSHRKCEASWTCFLVFSFKCFYIIFFRLSRYFLNQYAPYKQYAILFKYNNWKLRVDVMFQKQMFGSTRCLYYREEVVWFFKVTIFYFSI